MKIFRWILMSLLVLSLFVGAVGVGTVQAQEENPPIEETQEPGEVEPTEEPEEPGEGEETEEPGEGEETSVLNPVVLFLASLTGYEPEEITTLQEEGYGLGEIAKAYILSTLLSEMEEGTEPAEGETPEEGEVPEEGEGEETTIDLLMYLEAASEIGWGELFKEFGLHPGSQGGLGHLFKDKGEEKSNKPEWAGPPDDAGPPEWAGGPPPWAGPGNGEPEEGEPEEGELPEDDSSDKGGPPPWAGPPNKR